MEYTGGRELWGEYIEATYSFDLKGEIRFASWERILIKDLRRWLDVHQGKLSYYHTVQSFGNPQKSDGESHYAPLFFDLDSDKGRGTTLEDALRDARRVVDMFLEGYDVEPYVWFSGGKGFHITVPGVVFGAVPHKHLTYRYHHLADTLAERAGIKGIREKGTYDDTVYSVPRMWRIPNTKHSGSGLFKIPLTLAEIRTLGIDEIRELARSPRDIVLEDEEEYITDSTLAGDFEKACQEYEKRQEVHLEKITTPYSFDGVPPCVQYLLDNGLAQLGTKNQADMAMAGFCKDSGMPLEHALGFIEGWAESIPLSLTHVQNPQSRVQKSFRILRIVYADEKYHFSCGSIKKCGVEVDCEKCTSQRDRAIEIPLIDFSQAEHYGKRIAVEADAIGKHRNPLIVPYRVKGYCEHKVGSKMCLTCTMGEYFNAELDMCERTINFTARNPLTVDLITSTTLTARSKIRRMFGVKDKCTAFKMGIERGNVQILHLATRISSDFRLEDKVLRLKCYYMGHGLDLNRGYRFYGYVWPHPRTFEAVFIADRAEPLQSSLATFKLSKEELEELKVFQRGELSVIDKVTEIHKAFINSFLYIFGREELLLAIDMVYHSARWINFQRQRIKGWLDVLIIGDTGQGKSETAEKLMKYYDLGARAVGETSSRTGLAYSIQVIKGEEAWVAFGLLARANGYLVVVDETHDIAPNDFRTLTEIRSKGVIDVKMVVYGTAKAEVRVVWIANARGGKGKSLGTYGYGVMAIPDIPAFASLEDIRRFDYAVGLKAGQVSSDEINRDVRELPDVDHPYTAERCKNLVLWVWTRTVEQIVITHDTEKKILKAAAMAEEYVPDIPLVEAADIRMKIVRLATAFAGRLYNTPDGEKLIVEPEHVDAAITMLNDLYKSPGLDYWGYSDERARLILSEEQLQKLREWFTTTYDSWRKIARWFILTNEFSITHARNSLPMDKREVDVLIGWLLDKKFIGMAGSRYIKSPSGREFFYSILYEKRVEEAKEESLPPTQQTLLSDVEDDF